MGPNLLSNNPSPGQGCPLIYPLIHLARQSLSNPSFMADMPLLGNVKMKKMLPLSLKGLGRKAFLP